MPVYIPAMKIDVLGRIRNVQVPVQHAFHPVFEAVVNSIHATEERFGEAVAAEGKVEVRVHRVQQPELPGVPGRAPIPAVAGFTVVDNGGGFTDANLSAFETADTTAKAERGGKGVGRFTWLVVFDQAAVSSTFQAEDGTKRRRAFTFRSSPSGIDEFEEQGADDAVDLETRVELRRVRDRFAATLRRSSEVIAEKLFEHCFNYFVMGRCPRICLVDEAPDGTTLIDVNDRLREVRVSELKDLTVGPHGLNARHVQQRYATGRRHMAHLCAHQRVVTQIPWQRSPNWVRTPSRTLKARWSSITSSSAARHWTTPSTRAELASTCPTVNRFLNAPGRWT